MSNVIELFKNKIPSRRKVFYGILYGNNDHKDISFNKFKKDNYELKILGLYFLYMDNENYLYNTTIRNIFNYLSLNLRYNSFNSAKKTIIFLNHTKSQLINRLNLLDPVIDEKIINSLKYIIYNIDLLKVIISNKYDITCEEFEKMTKFEQIVNQILLPKDYDEAETLKIVFDNIKLLHYHDHKGRTFTDLFCNYIEYAKSKNNKQQYDYYKNIANYVLNIKNIGMNKRKVYQALNIDFIEVYESKVLEEKINNMKYDIETGRYILDDFVISIDNNQAIKIDDALSIEKTLQDTYVLGIHITDIYSLGKIGNELNDYEILIEGFNKSKGSLQESQKKYTISLFVEISSLGMILNYKIIPTIISVDKNFSYNDISKIAYNLENDTIVEKTISNLISLYSVVENNKLPQFLSLSNIASVLVSKFMLLNGCIYSEFYHDNNIPGIYLSGNKENSIYTLEKSNYDTGFKEFNSYSKSTSPIYDKSSLLCQYVLHQCAFRNVGDNYKDIIRYRLMPIVDDLNKKYS